MNVLLLSVLLFMVVRADEGTSWHNFKIKHHKIYKNQVELQLRQKIFNDNLRIIEEHNKKYEEGLVSYKLGINKYADLTDDEFSALFKILQANKKKDQDKQKELMESDGWNSIILESELTNNGVLPDKIDWTTKSVVSDVKNQQKCGSCWAISATGTLESQLAIQTGKLITLSEQQLLDCNTVSDGCGGGTVQGAYFYVKSNGLTLEKNYPYKAVQESCNNSRTKEVAVQIKGYVNIIRNNETDLRQAVGFIGPVSVALNGMTIKLYQEGIFDSECSDSLNHGVLAVGYGIDDNTGMEYWILKNSWGNDWGEQGYYRLRMGTNLCGVAKQACYPILDLERPGGSDGFLKKGGIVSFLVLGIYLFL